MKYKFLILILLLCFVFIANPSNAKTEKVDTHEDISIKKLHDLNLDTLYGLTWFDPKAYIIELQCSPNALKPEHLKLLNNFIQDGGTIWIYDCFLAEFFQMKPSPFETAPFKLKRTQTEYGIGDSKAPAFLCRGVSEPSNPLSTNAKQADVYVLEVTPGCASSIVEETLEDFHPFLRTALGNYLIGAVKDIGKGKVVFRPKIKDSVLGGKRLEINIKEFSAGYSPPGSVAQTAFKATILLKNGQASQVVILNKNFNLETGTNTVSLELQNIQQIDLLYPPDFDKIYLKDGTILKGFFTTSTIDIQTYPQKIEYLDKSSIQKIIFE